MGDLFETPELLPLEVQAILEKYSLCDFDYSECESLVKDLEKVGYTCEYDLSATPSDLRKILTTF